MLAESRPQLFGLWRHFIVAAVVLLAAGLPVRPGYAYHHEMQQAYRDLVHSVVRIETRYASIFAPPGAGSGVVIEGERLIATADHVLDLATEIWVVSADGQRQRAAVVRRAPEHDLALVRIEETGDLVPLALRFGAVRPGQCVLALGNVMNAGVGIFAGVVSLSACAEGCSAGAIGGILTDITTPPGLSGGALVDCENRALVGIVTFGILALNSTAPTAGIVGAVPATEVAQLLREEMACAHASIC